MGGGREASDGGERASLCLYAVRGNGVMHRSAVKPPYHRGKTKKEATELSSFDSRASQARLMSQPSSCDAETRLTEQKTKPKKGSYTLQP